MITQFVELVDLLTDIIGGTKVVVSYRLDSATGKVTIKKRGEQLGREYDIEALRGIARQFPDDHRTRRMLSAIERGPDKWWYVHRWQGSTMGIEPIAPTGSAPKIAPSTAHQCGGDKKTGGLREET